MMQFDTGIVNNSDLGKKSESEFQLHTEVMKASLEIYRIVKKNTMRSKTKTKKN